MNSIPFEQSMRLKHFAHVEMGQSPPSSDYSESPDIGLPFLQGTADFTDRFPQPQTYCVTPNKIAEPNDILLSVRAPVGELNIADRIYGIGRGLCAVRTGTTSTQNYLWWALHWARTQLSLEATGSTYEAVAVEDVSNLLIPVWNTASQTAIADYLDRKTAVIDDLLAEKQRLLEVLAEKRQALITQAVSRGLDPDVPLRDSGVEWLGEIPEHWETVKGKYLFDIYSGYAPDAVNFEGEDLNYFKVDDLNKNPGSLYMNSSSNSIGKDRHITLPEAPIILFPKRGAAIATNKVKIIENAGVYDTNLMGLKPNEKIEIEFLVYSLLARGLWDMADVSTVPQINNKHINPMAFPVPGRSEQQAIVQYLNEHTTTVDQQRAKVGQAIGKLKQYRTALITSAVTGKIDVQGVA